MDNWNEMSYYKYRKDRNRRDEEYNKEDEYRDNMNKIYMDYDSYYNQNTFSVDNLFNLDDYYED